MQSGLVRKLVLINIFLISISNGQYQTPPYQLPQYRFGQDINNYRITTTLRTTMPKRDPDSFFFGFFPIWAAYLVGLTCFCLLVSLIGLLCYFIGCVNPWKAIKRDSCISKQQKIYLDQHSFHNGNEYYDDISMRMLDTIDNKNSSNLFNDSKLVSDYEMDPKLKKKLFRREHL